MQEMQLRLASHLEALQSLEARRGIFDLLLRGLDGEVSQGESRLFGLQRELNLRASHASELEVELAQRSQRMGALDSELSALASALATRNEELEFQTRLNQELREQVSSLLTVANHQRELELLNERLRHQIEDLETDLAASEAHARELQAQAETRDGQLRAAVEAARQALEKRDALIGRLESEAAHSTALLDNINYSVKHLEPPVVGSGELAPEGATRLLVRAESGADVVHVLGRKTSIGRTPDNDLQVETKFISRHHAVVLAGPIHTIIEDLNSTNGVLVNGRKVTRQTLRDGDTVTIGKTHFRFAVRQPGERRTN
jgi:hypothetical protein